MSEVVQTKDVTAETVQDCLALLTKAAAAEDACPICLADNIQPDLTTKERVAVLSCGHKLCEACLKNMVMNAQSHNTDCSVCRAPIGELVLVQDKLVEDRQGTMSAVIDADESNKTPLQYAQELNKPAVADVLLKKTFAQGRLVELCDLKKAADLNGKFAEVVDYVPLPKRVGDDDGAACEGCQEVGGAPALGRWKVLLRDGSKKFNVKQGNIKFAERVLHG